MRKAPTLTRPLVFVSLLAVPACQPRVPIESQSPMREAASGDSAEPAPPVKDCLLRALGDPARRSLFGDEPVEIAAARQTDGSVRVAFRTPTSRVIVADGRLATKFVDESIFTARAVSYERHTEFTAASSPGRVPPANHDSLAQAIVAVCGQLPEAEAMEFAVRASKEGPGYSVLVEEIPYTPGGHTLYSVSPDFEINAVFPGE